MQITALLFAEVCILFGVVEAFCEVCSVFPGPPNFSLRQPLQKTKLKVGAYSRFEQSLRLAFARPLPLVNYVTGLGSPNCVSGRAWSTRCGTTFRGSGFASYRFEPPASSPK